jgi:hypothetical protein
MKNIKYSFNFCNRRIIRYRGDIVHNHITFIIQIMNLNLKISNDSIEHLNYN